MLKRVHVALSAFHDDKHNSFSVWQKEKGAWFFKCHAGCGDGDEIDFLEFHERLSHSEAEKRFLHLAGVNGSKLTCHHRIRRFNWQAIVEPLGR